MHDQIIRAIATANVAGVATQQAATQWFGVDISDISHVVMMICAIVSVVVAIATYWRKR